MMCVFAHVHDDEYALCVESNRCVKSCFCGMCMIKIFHLYLPTWLSTCECVTMNFTPEVHAHMMYMLAHVQGDEYALSKVQLMCQKLFLWHVHDQKFPSIFLLILYNIYN